MLFGHSPYQHRCLTLALGVTTILMTLSVPKLSIPLLVAQPAPVSTTPFPFKNEQFFRNGEFHRAFRANFEEEHAWSSSERLIRAEAAIYADLGHVALRELQELRDERVNQSYVATASLRIGLLELKKEDYGRSRLSLNDAVLHGEGSTEQKIQHIAGEALFWIGASHLMESGGGGYTQAIKAFQASAADFPANPRADDALYFLGQLAEARNDFDKALNLYNDLLTQYSQSDYRVAAAIRRTQLLNMLRRCDEALDELEVAETMWSWYKAEKIESTQQYHEQVDLELVLLRGEISIGRNDLPGAERAWLTLLYGLEGGYRRVGILGLAETYRVAGMPDSAVTLYSRIIDEGLYDSPGIQAEYFLAVTLLGAPNASDQEKAEARGALRLISESEDHMMKDYAALTLGEIAYRDGKYAEAVLLCQGIAERTLSPRIKARAQVLIGAGNLELHRFDNAAEAFGRVDAIVNRVPDREMHERDVILDFSARMRGVALMWGKRYNEAIAAYDSWLRGTSDSTHIPDVIWLKGETEFTAGHYDNAVRTMEGLIEEWPHSARVDQALYTIGWSHLRRNDLKRAESAFGRLVKAYPLSLHASRSQIRRADCHYLLKDFPTAVKMYRAVENMNPTIEEARYAAYQKAMATWKAGDTAGARREFSLFVANNGDSRWADDALFMSGLLDYRAADYQGAIRVMRSLLDNYTESRLHARAYYTIGDSYYRIRKFDEALAAYSIVTERYPESTYMKDAETGIVYARAAMGKIKDRSQLDAVQVAEIGGRPSYELELRRAQIFLDANRIEDAEKEYQAFIENNPLSRNLPVGWLGLAECALLRGDTASAIDTLATLLTRFDEGNVIPPAALRLVDLYLSESDTVSAIETLANVRMKFSESAAVAIALIRESELLLAIGQRDEAREVLRQGVEQLDSISGHLTRSGGRMLVELAELEAADGELESARGRWKLLSERTDSLAANALLHLGASYFRANEATEAIRAYEQLLKRISSDTALRARTELELARAYELSGEVEKARELHRAIIERHGNDPYGKETSRRLEEIQDL